ncbi:MAG: Rne/Rng family ribonuclease [Clostridia bacterium]|nr:Rne/Rng family ribonuclease [Clostridia bacterium]
MPKKTLYFDGYCGYVTAVVAEDGKMTEFNFEKTQAGSIVGNVYKGRVENVLVGMQAAFVNCGLERNCYLSAEDVLEAEKYDGSSAPAAFPELKEGDEILVQVVKAPVGKKGAKVTAQPTFVGKCLIYMPETPFVGVSRKIADEELRKNLVFAANRLRDDGEGIVLRTAAPYAKRRQLETEYSYLKNVYADVKEKFARAKVGDLLYSDYSLPARVLRDTLSSDIEGITVGSKELYDEIENIVNLHPMHKKPQVTLYNSQKDMFDDLGIAGQILGITSTRAELDNGAYLIIERTEALTVIDVNTGKFTGDYNLEQTVYHTNIMAAREIARQMRLRNIGGIVVVDFIDMQNAGHKKALVEELERALKSDKAKCTVSPMSRFGLVEFTRKRIGGSPLHHMTKPCRYCREGGYTLSHEFILFGLRAKILSHVAEGARSLRIDMNNEVLTKLLSWDELRNDLHTRASSAEIYAVPHRTYHEEQFNIRRDVFEIPPDAVKII